MAKSMLKSIEDNILACAICFEQLQDPIGLPCLHGFCLECLQKWHKSSDGQTHVVCPICKASTALPQDGIRGFPGHFVMNNLKEMLNEEHKVHLEAKPSKPSCDLCKADANTHCLDCKEYLCTQCHRNHNAFKAMAEHKIVTASDVQLGKVTSKGRHCSVHGEPVRYYCQIDNRQVCLDCVCLNTCAVQHSRVSLREAAQAQQLSLREKLSECLRTKTQLHKSLLEIARVHTSIDQSKQQALKTLEDQITQKKLELEMEHVRQAARLAKYKLDIETRLEGIQVTCDLVSETTEHKSDNEITYNFAAMSKALDNIMVYTLPDITTNESLPCLDVMSIRDYRFDTSVVTSHPPKKLLSNSWVKRKQFSTSPDLHILQGIAAGPDGDIAVTSQTKGAKVFNRNGEITHSLQCAPNDVLGIAVTSDDRYIITGHTKLLCYLSTGTQSSVIKSKYSSAFVSGQANTVTVDNKGRVISGLLNHIIAIYYADGSLMTHFQTDAEPYFMSVLSNNRLVVTFSDETLVLMSYSGAILNVIQPPPSVHDWQPGSTCCTPDDEIFVVNEANQCQVYRYTSKGDYLDMVTDDVKDAIAIAISRNGNELFVAEEHDTVKIFKRE